MESDEVFVNYNKFVPPSHPFVPIDLKIDLTGVNKVEPANSYYDGNFLWRVKWQVMGLLDLTMQSQLLLYNSLEIRTTTLEKIQDYRGRKINLILTL